MALVFNLKCRMRNSKIMYRKFFVFIFVFCFLFAFENSYAQRSRRNASLSARTITVVTEPKAFVWVDGVRRGETDENGKLLVKPLMNGTRKLIVRADGFREVAKTITATQKGTVKITLIETNDQAELVFQEAEKVLSEDKNKAAELYEKAIRLRPKYEAAYIGLARALSSLGNHDEALKVISKARRVRPSFPEASAVEGRIYKSLGEYDKAIDSFDRAIKEGKGFQPEAHTGLALLFKEEAESARAENDIDDEKYFYEESAKSFEKAIEQLSATEPVVYLFLGKIYEDMGDKKKAIAVYKRFLRDMPDHGEVPAVESFIVQLNKPGIIQ